MILNFGKFRGRSIQEVPLSYLAWVVEQPAMDPWVKRSCREEIGKRCGPDMSGQVEHLQRLVDKLHDELFHATEANDLLSRKINELQSARLPQRQEDGFDEVLRAWRKRLAVQFHPDKGGNPEAMKAINSGYDLLVAMLRQGRHRA